MTKRVYDRIMEGLDGARAYLDGTADKRRYRVHAVGKDKPRGLSDAEEARIHIAVDPDNPEWTAEDFKRAKPFAEVFPTLAEAWRTRIKRGV